MDGRWRCCCGDKASSLNRIAFLGDFWTSLGLASNGGSPFLLPFQPVRLFISGLVIDCMHDGDGGGAGLLSIGCKTSDSALKFLWVRVFGLPRFLCYHM